MTKKDREDRFIEKCRQEMGALTFESEVLLRYGFAAGADELGRVAFDAGVETQRDNVLAVLGAASRKVTLLP